MKRQSGFFDQVKRLEIFMVFTIYHYLTNLIHTMELRILPSKGEGLADLAQFHICFNFVMWLT